VCVPHTMTSPGDGGGREERPRVSDVKIVGVYGFDVNDEVRLRFLPFAGNRHVCWLSGPGHDILYVIKREGPLPVVIDDIRYDVRKMADGAIDVKDLLNEIDLYLSGHAVLIYR